VHLLQQLLSVVARAAGSRRFPLLLLLLGLLLRLGGLLLLLRGLLLLLLLLLQNLLLRNLLRLRGRLLLRGLLPVRRRCRGALLLVCLAGLRKAGQLHKAARWGGRPGGSQRKAHAAVAASAGAWCGGPAHRRG
jgi:hypothetical protein